MCGAVTNLLKFIFYGVFFLICIGIVIYSKSWAGRILFSILAIIIFIVIKELLNKDDW